MRHALAVLLAAASILGGCGPPDLVDPEGDSGPPATNRVEVPAVRRLEAATEALPRTTVVAHRGADLAPGRSVLWCAAFPLAWDALKDGPVGGPLRLGPPAPPAEVEALNAGDFPAASLDPASYVAVGGFFRDGVVEKVHEALRERFGASAPIPEFDVPPGEKAALGYAFLRKALPFAIPFETNKGPIRFAGGTKRVAAFGILPDSRNPKAAAIRDQVTILFSEASPEGEHRFALELAPKGGRDRLVLACPGGTPASLAAAWDAVAAGAAGSSPETLPGDGVLIVPRMDFDLDHRFGELEGAPLRNPGWEGTVIWTARERIRFELSEAGARLEAEARIAVGRAAMPRPSPRFVFDRPFLLALVETGKDDPYFLMWVDNDEILAEAAR